MSQIFKHIGGVFLTYSIFEYLQEDLYEFLFL